MRKTARFCVYLLGLMLLALGIVMNARTGLGVSAVSSIPHAASRLTGLSPGVTTAGLYFVCVLLQALMLGRKCPWTVLLQLPFSVVFGSFIHLFDGPFDYYAQHPVMQSLMLLGAIMLTAMGSTLVVAMDVVPNAPDGLARLIGERLGKDFGFGKSALDAGCVLVTVLGTWLAAGEVLGVGLGTLASALLVGRLIALFGRLLRPRLTAVLVENPPDADMEMAADA